MDSCEHVQQTRQPFARGRNPGRPIACCGRRTAGLLLCLVAFASGHPAAANEPQAAAWEARELTFNYFGFTSRYSCEGLRDKVEQALIALGARRDLSVTTGACTRVGRPELFPSLQIKMSTLAPVAVNAAGDTVKADWKTVNLGGIGMLDHGDCELAEQIKSQILPLFTTRNLKSRLDCTPHQESPGGVSLTVDVLVPAKH